MTRTEAIEAIAANLARLQEDDLATLVDVTTAWVQPERVLKLSDAERAAVEQAREDFEQGRSLSLEEAEARTKAFLEARRASNRRS